MSGLKIALALMLGSLLTTTCNANEYTCPERIYMGRVLKLPCKKNTSVEVERWQCELKYFTDHLGHVHGYILCGIKEVGVRT